MNSWLIPLIGISLAAWTLFCKHVKVPDGQEHSNGTGIFENRNVCNTIECLQVADDFSKSVNESVNPCDNFYKFACGNWESHNPPRKNRLLLDQLERFSDLARFRLRDELKAEPSAKDILPIQKMKNFYKSCMQMTNLEGLESVNSILQGANGWPMIMDSKRWNRSTTTWQKNHHYYEELTGFSVFYQLNIPDLPSERAELQFVSPAFFKITTRPPYKWYRRVMRKVANLLIEQNKETVPKETLERDIDDLIMFEEKLYKASQNSSGNVTFTNISLFMKWWNANSTAIDPRGNIEWEMILQKLLNIINRPMTDDTPFKLTNVSYFRQLPEILQSTDERTIVNFIHWYYVFHMLPISDDSSYLINDGTLDNYDELRWLFCLRLDEPVSGLVFARKYYGKDKKIAAEEITRNIMKSFGRQIKKSNWMSVAAKKAATEKLKRMKYILGYEDWYNNETALIDYYKDVTIGDNYAQNILSLEKNRWRAMIQRWGKPVEYIKWPINVLQASGEYREEWNRFFIPAGTFQSPLFDGSMPDYISYGTAGYLIGHEVGHGFDSGGIYYGLRPNKTLFTDDMSKIYMERAECFIDLFDDYFEGSGNRTLRENIADWTGLQAALSAYQKVKDEKHPSGELKLPKFEEFTDLQMFFLSFAQTWCIGSDEGDGTDSHNFHSLRVIGTLSNTAAFSKAFHCPDKSLLNPERKCNIWIKENFATRFKSSLFKKLNRLRSMQH